VYGTVYYVEELVKRLAALTREVKMLQSQAPQASTATAAAVAETPAPASVKPSQPPAMAAARDLPQWFAQRRIQVQIDPSAADTSGFFDEAAQQLGEHYELLAELLDRVAYAYRKNYPSTNLNLSKIAQKDLQTITQFCRTLYEHTFFSRYHYQKTEKIVRLNLQTAPAVRQFFEGGWLEWYALMQLLDLQQERQVTLPHARGVKVTFPNEDLHELDVACLLPNDMLLCIECKSGEFRREIDKYLRLSKRLGVPKSHFIICASDLSEEQARGLSAMYDISFVNLQTLKAHLQRLF
jgi:uncharacterized membrane-anchored protein YhcB (DUF1043 family)